MASKSTVNVPEEVKLQATEGGKGIIVPGNVACQAKLIATMIVSDNGDNEEGSSEEEEEHLIPLPNVIQRNLEKIIKFMHILDVIKQNGNNIDIERPLRDNSLNKILTAIHHKPVLKWIKEEIDDELDSQTLLFELIKDVNYMDIPELLNLLCAKVASQIKGKTPAEIRKTFNITEDFTPEEEAKIKKDNPWLEKV